MSDVIDRLAHLNQAPGAPLDATVAADLARAQDAFGRQLRRRAATAGVGLTLTLGLGVGATVASEQPGGPSGTELVAYEGEQPQGFQVDQVPEGFRTQGANAFHVTIAREGDRTHPHNFEDKLVVTLESGLARPGELKGDPVSVDGAPGAIWDSGHSLSLEFHDGTHEVVVQMWDSVGLTPEQLVEFAEGVSVTPDARREEANRGYEGTTVEKDGRLYRLVR